jgi:hypothetical protein
MAMMECASSCSITELNKTAAPVTAIYKLTAKLNPGINVGIRYADSDQVTSTNIIMKV